MFERIREAEVGDALGSNWMILSRPVEIGGGRHSVQLNAFVLYNNRYEAHLLPPMEILLDLRKLGFDEEPSLLRTPSGELFETRFRETDYFLMVIPEILEKYSLLVSGMGVHLPPSHGVDFTPELAVAVDEWMDA